MAESSKTKAGGNAPKARQQAKPAARKAVKRSSSTGPATDKRVKVTLVRSVIGTKQSHRATVLGLGLKRMHQSVELEDTASVRGMINKVGYLLRVEA